MFNPTLRATAAALVIAALAPAQTTAGSDAPTFEFKAALNGAPESFAGLENRLVLVEFFATW